MRTSITISGLQTYAFHGLFSEEQKLGQKFVFDLRVELARAASHADDALHGSVRYDALVERTVSVAQSARFHTLEALGEGIARALLREFLPVERVIVRVAKLSPPIPHTLERVAVEIELARE